MLRALLWSFALVNVAYGLFALIWMRRAAALVRLEPTTTAAQGEIRALYGGLVLGLGAMTVFALWRPEGGVLLQALALGFAGLAVGRLVSLLADGFTGWNFWLLFGEGGAAGFLWWAGLHLAREAQAVATS